MDDEEKIGRDVRRSFYRDVSKAIESPPWPVTEDGKRVDDLFPASERAELLRRMADHLEKSAEIGRPVDRRSQRQAALSRVVTPPAQPVRDWQQEQEALREKGQQAQPMRFFRPDPSPDPNRKRKPGR